MKKSFVLFLLFCFVSLTWAQTAIEGVRVPNSVQLAGRTLQLNGAGIRYKAIVKVYVAALYMEQTGGTPEQIYNNKGSTQLVITMLRNINSAELGRLFIKGMEENTTKEEQTKLIADFRYMGELFARFRNLDKGESLIIQWPANGAMAVSVDGFFDQTPIKNPEFRKALLSIWLGENPADWQLKSQLLNNAKANNNNPVQNR